MNIALEKITLKGMNELDRDFQRDPATFADMSLFSAYRYSREESRKGCERYGASYLTDAGRSAAAAYGACCERLCEQLGSALGLEKDVCRSAAYAALEQLPDALPELEKA